MNLLVRLKHSIKRYVTQFLYLVSPPIPSTHSMAATRCQLAHWRGLLPGDPSPRNTRIIIIIMYRTRIANPLPRQAPPSRFSRFILTAKVLNAVTHCPCDCLVGHTTCLMVVWWSFLPRYIAYGAGFYLLTRMYTFNMCFSHSVTKWVYDNQ